MATGIQKGIPGVPVAALDSIQDQNVKQVLRAVVDGWFVRNGQSGSGDNRFVTAAELGNLSGQVGGLSQRVSSLSQSKDSFLTPGQINRIVNDLQAQILNSLLWKELGSRIDAIDLSIVTEQNARIAAVKKVADDLATESATRLGFDTVQGSKINTLETTTSTQATQISGLITRVGASESSIVTLNQTTATQALALTALTTRVGTSETNVTNLQTTTATQASSLTSLSARTTTLESGAVTAQSNISTLQTVTATHTSQLTTLTTRVGNAESEISQEQTTRASADTAITQSVATQFAAVNGNLSALQTQITTSSNTVAALSSSVTTLQTTVGQNSTAIQLEATARANADGDLYSKYSVKIDQNGYVSGYGLMSTANNSTPYSQFIVRANSFAIGSPEAPGSITPSVPFIVQTTPQTMTDGTVIPPGVYMDYAMVKRLDGAFINAGLLYASQIYTGSQYIDLTSKLPVNVVAATSTFVAEFTTDNKAATQPAQYLNSFSSVMRFYAPGWHSAVPVNQRIRSSVSTPLTFTVTVTCACDEWVSIWYRKGSNVGGYLDGWTAPPGNSFNDENQSGYGSAAITIQLTESLADNDWIEFTATPLGYYFRDYYTGNYGYYSWRVWNYKLSPLKYVSMAATVTNL